MSSSVTLGPKTLVCQPTVQGAGRGLIPEHPASYDIESSSRTLLLVQTYGAEQDKASNLVIAEIDAPQELCSHINTVHHGLN